MLKSEEVCNLHEQLLCYDDALLSEELHHDTLSSDSRVTQWLTFNPIWFLELLAPRVLSQLTAVSHPSQKEMLILRDVEERIFSRFFLAHEL